MSLNINSLADMIEKELCEYSEETDNAMAEGIDRISYTVCNSLKNHPVLSKLKGTGKYKKGFYVKKLARRQGYKLNAVANKKYRLTHLLERSHLTRNGVSRTRAFPHWEDAQKKLEELTEEMFE